MSKITGKRIGQLIISSDVVTTVGDVELYVNNVSADLQQAIDDIGKTAVSGYVPLSALSAEVLKIISANYMVVANYLDGTPEDGIVTIDSNNY